MTAALARWVASRPGRALAVVALMTLVMGVSARNVRLDNNFAGLFSTSSADAEFRERYRSTFGADDGLLVAVFEVAEPSASMFDAVGRASDAVAKMAEVRNVDSVTTLDVLRPEPINALGPAFAPETAGLPLSTRIDMAASSRLGAGNLVSDDGRVALVVGELDPRYDSFETVTDPAEHFRRVVDAAVERSEVEGLRVHYGGVAFTRIAAISEMQGDLLKLFPVATVMMGLLLWWFFRRPVAVIAPMVAIVASVVGTAGVIGLAGDDINQITIVFPVLLMGVVVATSTHVIHRYYRERAAGSDATVAARTTLERILPAAVVCTITNAIGFASLATANMSILHEFGLYCAAGVGFCFVSTSLAVPALLVIRDSAPSQRYFTEATEAAAAELVDSSESSGGRDRARAIARRITSPQTAGAVQLAGIVCVGVAVVVALGARYDYSLSGMLNPDRPVSVANRLVDTELAGIVPIEISLLGPKGAFGDTNNLDRVAELDSWLEAEESIDAVGLPDVADAARSLGLPGAVDVASYPQVARIVTSDLSHTRLRAFHRDTGSTSIVALADRIDRAGARIFRGTGIEVRVTGEAPVAYAGMNELTRELVASTLLAIALIVIAIGIAFRSVVLAAVALLPNVVPIVVGLAIYRLANDVLDPVAGVVFCVAIGLAADDTVHLINRWRELERTSPTSREALIEAVVTVRRAMVSSSAVLIASFLALGVSGFPTNRTLGILGAVVLALALASDLVFGTTGLALVSARRDARNAASSTRG